MTPSVSPHHCHTEVLDAGNPLAERGIRRALWLTGITMVVEIVGGWWFNSMAVLADGWHMSSHAAALGLSAFAYAYARRNARHPAYAFGTWKVEVLGSYTSALFLIGIAALMTWQSIDRLLDPRPIHYREAIGIAVVGLVVNLVCAWWLRDSHDHGHHHDHDHDHDHAHEHGGHPDMNLRAAYLHVVADALTSVLAILALTGGLLWGAAWLDPAVGLVGAALIVAWATSLLRSSGRVLLDAEMDGPVVAEIRTEIGKADPAATICDLHVWRVGRQQYAVVLSLATPSGKDADFYRQTLRVHEELVHVTVEVLSRG